MDKKTLTLLESNVDSCRIDSLERNWIEYEDRARLVLDELEGVFGQPITNAITNAGYAGDENEVTYMYTRLAFRVANKINGGLPYYAVTGDAEKITENYTVDDPAKFWLQSLDSIKDVVTKEIIKECIQNTLNCLRMMEEIREIDMFAMKAFMQMKGIK